MKRPHYTDYKEKKCPECGKNFIVPSQNVYKEKVGREIKPFCSWKCLCAWRKVHPEEDEEARGGGRPVAILKVGKDGEIIDSYEKIKDAAQAHGVSAYRITTRVDTGRYDDKFECYWRRRD